MPSSIENHPNTFASKRTEIWITSILMKASFEAPTESFWRIMFVKNIDLFERSTSNVKKGSLLAVYLLLWLTYLVELVVVKLVLVLPWLIRGQFLDFETMSERASPYKFTAGLKCQVQWSTFHFNLFSLSPWWLFWCKVRSKVHRRKTQEMSNETNKLMHNFQGNHTRCLNVIGKN